MEWICNSILHSNNVCLNSIQWKIGSSAYVQVDLFMVECGIENNTPKVCAVAEQENYSSNSNCGNEYLLCENVTVYTHTHTHFGDTYAAINGGAKQRRRNAYE